MGHGSFPTNFYEWFVYPKKSIGGDKMTIPSASEYLCYVY